jgi:hypothetical protein
MQDIHGISRRALPKEKPPSVHFALLRSPPDGLQIRGAEVLEEVNLVEATNDLEEFRHSAPSALRARFASGPGWPPPGLLMVVYPYWFYVAASSVDPSPVVGDGDLGLERLGLKCLNAFGYASIAWHGPISGERALFALAQRTLLLLTPPGCNEREQHGRSDS